MEKERDRDRSERRSALLRSARQAFATRGYHETRVDDIATGAGVAKGTFYLYFKDKRGVFVELIDALFARIRGAITSVDVDGDIPEQVRNNVRAIIGALQEDPETTQILMSHAAGLDQDFAAEIEGFYESVKTLLTRSLQDGQARHIVRAGDAQLFASFTIGGLKELLRETTSGQRSYSASRLVEEIYALLMDGFLRIPPTAKHENEPPTAGTESAGRKRRSRQTPELKPR